MKKAITQSKPSPIEKLVELSRQGKLVVVIGAGVSVGLTGGEAPSWIELIRNGFEYAHKKGQITAEQFSAWGNQLKSNDLDDLLSAAEFIGRKLGAPHEVVYGRWLQEVFSDVKPTNSHLISALQALVRHGIPICTLNYDPLLEAVTGLPALKVSETQKVLAWMRREYSAILHLHGVWDDPGSCVLGIRDYEAVLSDEIRDFFQKNLAIFNNLLFIGCGDTFADPNFSSLTNWLHKKFDALSPRHIALVRESDLARRNSDRAWLGFVEPLSFGDKHDDLAQFLINGFSSPVTPKSTRRKIHNAHELNAVIEEYKSFLVRDCGQMTIEGVSADMDTGQRKFDLERLFVPLNVSACPPEFSPGDPDREKKIKEWESANNQEVPFGRLLAKHKRVALLALPGGGKTLLLKRLAVAYADPARQSASPDELPGLNLVPLLIRCREWRDHIRLPIKTLLKNIGDITGQPSLSGLSDALVPILKKGHVLLLVDGLDEIHNDADRTTFVDNLESFLEEYGQIRLVVTSREAGFGLVAPSLSRFCARWRIAPLSEAAVSLLCAHWHRLMNGEGPSVTREGEDVAQLLLKSGSLRRLAENPLLLTMLLVVKHGAGGLPPDRVSLYGRAVEVLLDTWNIKGHAPLNAKEAVPQLAYVAFQLMCKGRQTATEQELLALLDEAREKHPNIKRYAKDSPYAFLRRVELRSSLLLEAGHQIEKGRAVPFYQFRHLTFQEYLTAVAATEGHYQTYRQEDTVLTPLKDYTQTEEWKEVIPMVAVLARKRAEPLLIELIAQGEASMVRVESGEIQEADVVSGNQKLSGAAGRLLQCFVEEVEASPETISSALRLVAFFAHGCKSSDDWEVLCRGPYGDEFFRQAWDLYVSKKWSSDSWLMNSCAAIACYQKPVSYWLSDAGQREIDGLLGSAKEDEYGRGLFVVMGMLWNDGRQSSLVDANAGYFEKIERLLFNKNPNIASIAIWIWANVRRDQKAIDLAPPAILDVLLKYWLREDGTKLSSMSEYAVSLQAGLDRDSWVPELTSLQEAQIRIRLDREAPKSYDFQDYERRACLVACFHARSIISDDELIDRIKDFLRSSRRSETMDQGLSAILKKLGGRLPAKKQRSARH